LRILCIYDFDDLIRNGRGSEIEAYLSPSYQSLVTFYKKLGGEIHDVPFSKDELRTALTFQFEDTADEIDPIEKAVQEKQSGVEADFFCAKLEEFSKEFHTAFGKSPLSE